MNTQTQEAFGDVYEFHSPIKGVCKSYGIWKRKSNSISPMVYFSKPKNVSEYEFIEFINNLKFIYVQD